MNPNAAAKFHRFGKVGKVVLTILSVLSIIASIGLCVATIYVAALPKDAVKVAVVQGAEFQVNQDCFDEIWNIIADSAAFAVSEDSAVVSSQMNLPMALPENQPMDSKIQFFNQKYSKAQLYTRGNTKVVEAQSDQTLYCSSDLVMVCLFWTLLMLSVTVAIFLLRTLFVTLTRCDSPFRPELVQKLHRFGWALLPVALLSSISRSLSNASLSAGQGTCVTVDWGVLLAFVVTLCLVTVFRYGVQLQQESDETL